MKRPQVHEEMIVAIEYLLQHWQELVFGLNTGTCNCVLLVAASRDYVRTKKNTKTTSEATIITRACPISIRKLLK